MVLAGGSAGERPAEKPKAIKIPPEITEDPNVVGCPFKQNEVPYTDFWSFVKDAMYKNPSKVALIDAETGQQYTFGQVIETVERLAAHFQNEAKFGPGVNVAFLSNNSSKSLISLLAVIATGATVVPVTMAYSQTTADFAMLAVLANCTRAIIGKEFKAQALAFQNDHPDLCKGVYLVDGFDPNFSSLSKVIDSQTPFSFHTPKVVPDENVASVIFTSGSTSVPKSILHTHLSMVAQICGPTPPLEMYDSVDVVFQWNPFTHVSGLMSTISALHSGAQCVIDDTFSMTAEKFRNRIETYKVTGIVAFPTTLLRILRQFETDQCFPTVRKIHLVGSTIPAALKQKISELFNLTSLQNGYGLSEAVGLVALSEANSCDISTVGYPVSNCYVKVICQDTGVSLGSNQAGELAVYSPTIMSGYLGNTANTEASFAGKFFRTGDLAKIDENGRVVILDRIKSMIKCLDYQVCPSELENMLEQHPAVLEAAVVGVPMEEFGEAPTACVVVASNIERSPELADELAKLVNALPVAAKHLHGGVHFFDNLPKTKTGKLARQKLLQQVEDRIK